MKLPIDLKAVIEAATDIESARNTPVSVSVLIDDSAPGDVAAHVRSAFVGAGAHARVTVGYFVGPAFSPYEGDDMAVIVAGFSEEVGRRAAEIRAAGVPVMVVTSMPRLVADMASAYGNPIPEGDLVAPEGVEGCEADGDAACESGDVAGVNAQSPEILDAPIPIDAAAAAALDCRMGEWVVAACREKRLALALSFPFVRRPLSLEAVSATSLQNAGIGLVLFIPGADMPLMTLNQAKMLLQIAAAYGEPMSAARAKELAAIVGAARDRDDSLVVVLDHVTDEGNLGMPQRCPPGRGRGARHRLGRKGRRGLCGHEGDGPCGRRVLRTRRQHRRSCGRRFHGDGEGDADCGRCRGHSCGGSRALDREDGGSPRRRGGSQED